MKNILSRLTVALMSLAVLITSPGIAAADNPKELQIAVILASSPDNPWDRGLLKAMDRVAAEKPHGLEITYNATDPVWGDDALRAMSLFAKSGKYGVVWAHSSYSDQVKQIQAEFPDIMFVVSGSGNEGLGGNQYWVYKRLHEPAYLLGILAGSVSENGKLGVVGTFPADDVNDEINAFFAGAKTVNPDVESNVAFIESWYDPGKAAEMASAQISTGVDVIFQLASNFEVCKQNDILCFGNYEDENALAPEVVASSAVADWSPDVKWIVDEWWAFKADGKPYEGNTSNDSWFSMADGGSDIAPFHGVADRLPEDARSAVAEAAKAIKDGSLVVELDVSDPTGTR